MDNGSFRPHHTRSRQDWRSAQSSPNMDFPSFFLDDCNVLECPAEQLWSLFVVAPYFLLQSQKNISQTMVRWSEMPSSTTLLLLLMLPGPYPSYVDLLLYPSPMQMQTVQASAFASSIVVSIPINKARQSPWRWQY